METSAASPSRAARRERRCAAGTVTGGTCGGEEGSWTDPGPDNGEPADTTGLLGATSEMRDAVPPRRAAEKCSQAASRE